jgi:hypothetical protein
MTALTKTTVAELLLPANKVDAIFFDDVLPGFGLRLRLDSKRKIRRSYVVQFRIDGRF